MVEEIHTNGETSVLNGSHPSSVLSFMALNSAAGAAEATTGVPGACAGQTKYAAIQQPHVPLSSSSCRGLKLVHAWRILSTGWAAGDTGNEDADPAASFALDASVPLEESNVAASMPERPERNTAAPSELPARPEFDELD